MERRLAENMRHFLKKNLQLIAVSAGHFTNDFYVSLIPPILFAFSRSMGLTLTQQSMIAFVIITCASLFQPVVGYFLDKIGKSGYLIISLIWISFLMSITGLITNYYILIIIVGLASIASSVYHPLGISIATNLSSASRGKSLSIFMTIGAFAATFSPMISIPIVSKFGLKSLVFLVIPGFLVAYLLKFAKIDKIKCHIDSNKKREDEKKKKISKNKIKRLSLVVLMCVVRVMFQRLLVVFGVQLMIIKGIGVIPAGIILSAHLFLRSVGTLSGGYLSDKFGESRILIIFNILSFAIYTMLIFTQGIWVILGIILFGYMSNATATANFTITHKLLPEDINLGNGTINGLPGTIGSFLILVFGKFADIYGLMEMAQVIVCLGLIPVFISFYISKKYGKVKTKTAMIQ